MIIKSIGRKARAKNTGQGSGQRTGSTRASKNSGASRGGGVGVAGLSQKSPFKVLTAYMNRGIEEEHGKAVLWHNFPGGEQMSETELIAEFERNASVLRERRNGNVLYHEILSFSTLDGHAGHDDPTNHKARAELHRHLADIGQEYLRQRAPGQLAYGVIHHDTDHLHLHLMISANDIGQETRVRWSKAQFAEIQQNVERYTLDRYPELKQQALYQNTPEQIQAKRQEREHIKSSHREQSMHVHRGQASRKLDLAARLHQALETARDMAELSRFCQTEGIQFYTRGKNVGIKVREADGQERKYRLSTLGLEPHYSATNERLMQLEVTRRQNKTNERAAPETTERAPRGEAHVLYESQKTANRPATEQTTERTAQSRSTSSPHPPPPPPPPPPPQFKEIEVPIPAKLAEVGERILKTAERTADQVIDSTKGRVKEEIRFGKEVGKDFLFGTDRADRRPDHQKPPEPKKRAQTQGQSKGHDKQGMGQAEQEPPQSPQPQGREQGADGASGVGTAAEPMSKAEAMLAEFRAMKARQREKEKDKDKDKDRGDRDR